MWLVRGGNVQGRISRVLIQIKTRNTNLTEKYVWKVNLEKSLVGNEHQQRQKLDSWVNLEHTSWYCLKKLSQQLKFLLENNVGSLFFCVQAEQPGLTLQRQTHRDTFHACLVLF